jgi:hypothetical protein
VWLTHSHDASILPRSLEIPASGGQDNQGEFQTRQWDSGKEAFDTKCDALYENVRRQYLGGVACAALARALPY